MLFVPGSEENANSKSKFDLIRMCDYDEFAFVVVFYQLVYSCVKVNRLVAQTHKG